MTGVDWVNLIVVAALLGLIPGAIAHSRGESFLQWWVYGAALFIVALPMSLLIKDERWLPCPFCRTSIDRGARVCPQCRSDVYAHFAAQAPVASPGRELPPSPPEPEPVEVSGRQFALGAVLLLATVAVLTAVFMRP